MKVCANYYNLKMYIFYFNIKIFLFKKKKYFFQGIISKLYTRTKKKNILKIIYKFEKGDHIQLL